MINFSRYLLASFVAFLFIFGFEWAFHGIYLQDLYAQTPELWRSKESMQQYFPYLFGGQLFWALVLGFIFIKGYENKGVIEGIRFGLLIALLYVPTHLMCYTVAPYSFELIVKWIVGSVIELTIVGMILALLYKPQSVNIGKSGRN